tara:strand:- start:355 stop:603 length:249 start_codon:yes stop_codon:yes gene_type:complete
MARPVIKFDQKNCAECGIRMPPVTFKRPYAKLCPDCKSDLRAGNHELRQIFQELKTTTTETEDWGSQNITTKDDAMLRHHRF